MIRVNFTAINRKDLKPTRITIYKNKNIKNDFLEKLRSLNGIEETKRVFKIIFNGSIENAIKFYKEI